jgi:hypothetical protein
MPIPSEAVPWAGSLAWLLVLALAAFLVSWWVADRLRASQLVYVGALTLTTAALTVGYLAWAHISVRDFLTDNWVWGLVVGVLAGAVPAVAVSRMKATVPAEHGVHRAERVAWDGVVYAISEGLLLSTLPALMAWQMVHSLGWSGTAGQVSRVVLPLLASVVVIITHHLGYPEFRNPREMSMALVGCGLLTVGFLFTGNILTAPVGHIFLHTAAVLHGTELPPHREPAGAAPGAGESLTSGRPRGSGRATSSRASR